MWCEVWCGVMWCVVWCGVVWCEVRCGVVRCCTAQLTCSVVHVQVLHNGHHQFEKEGWLQHLQWLLPAQLTPPAEQSSPCKHAPIRTTTAYLSMSRALTQTSILSS